jgi:predicted nucleic-acid-binding Zn-ribbon protein
MSESSNQISEKTKCPKCYNNAILKDNLQQDTTTLICLNCGYYQTGSVSFFMHITDVNQLRLIHGLEPISKLKEVNRNL